MSKRIEHPNSPAANEMVEMFGVSKKSWSAAAREALIRASETYKQITERYVIHTTAVIEEGEIVEYHVDVTPAGPNGA
jgi:flavin-binding protein dodecin